MREFIEFIHGIDPFLLSVLAFLVGTLVGNWTAIGRDKRQEFNAAVRPMRAHVLSLRERPGPSRWLPDSADLDHLQHYMWPLHRRFFRAAIERYKQCHNQQLVRDPDYGSESYADDVVMAGCADDILKHLKYR